MESLQQIPATMPENTGLINLEKEEVLSDNIGYKARLRQLPEVQNMTNEIDITNSNSILAFRTVRLKLHAGIEMGFLVLPAFLGRIAAYYLNFLDKNKIQPN